MDLRVELQHLAPILGARCALAQMGLERGSHPLRLGAYG
jgi:hypothetical protein